MLTTVHLSHFIFVLHIARSVQLTLENKETVNTCVTLSLPDNELRLLHKISGNLEKFLNRNVVNGQKSLKNDFNSFALKEESLSDLDEEVPLESILLRYQMAMHRDIKNAIEEIKHLVLQGKSLNDVIIPKTVLGEDKTRNISPLGNTKQSYRSTDYTFRPMDCSEVLVSGQKKSGVYQIFPFKCHCTRPVNVYCDMDTDGGGWTVFLSRANSSKPLNFTRNWIEYKNGFGTPDENSEYWLGNENLNILTDNQNYMLRMDANDGHGREIWGQWSVFKVNPEYKKYLISVTGHDAKSTAYDRFSYSNNNYFTTYDKDSDKNAKSNCAQTHKGGFWYNNCHHINPTGVMGKLSDEGIKVTPWSKIDSTPRYANWLQLKIRPKSCSSPISVAKLNTHNCT